MKFVPVKEDPRLMKRDTHRYVVRHDLQEFINEFMESGVKFARVECTIEEYSSLNGVYTVLRTAVINSNYPIETLVKNGAVYMVRTDM